MQSAALKTSDHRRATPCWNSLGGTAKAFELAHSPHHHHWVIPTNS